MQESVLIFRSSGFSSYLSHSDMSQIRPISFEMVLMNFFIFFDVLIFGLDIEHIFDLLDLDIIYISVFGFQGTITLFMIFDHDLSLTV